MKFAIPQALTTTSSQTSAIMLSPQPGEHKYESKFWSYFTVLDPAGTPFQTTEDIEVDFWDLRNSTSSQPIRKESEFSAKLAEVEAAVTDFESAAKDDPSDCSEGNSRSSRQFFLFASIGCPSVVNNPIHVPTNALTRLNDVLGFQKEYHSFYFTRLFHCSYHFIYDGSEADTDQPSSLVIFLRCPRNSQSIVCIMRIRLSDYACTALLCGCDHQDVKRLVALCAANAELIRLHPLYLLLFIYELRYRSWTLWLSRLWLQINEIETATSMTSESWVFKNAPTERLNKLRDTNTLLKYLHSTNTELCHGENVISFANKLGKFCLEILDVLETARQQNNLPKLSQRSRTGLEERIKFNAVRCDALRDRMSEMKERLRGQINVSFTLIAQKDSGVMKAIAILGLAFLPATLITAIWSANLFELEPDTNWRVYLGTTTGLTLVVFLFWGFYMRISRRPHYALNRGENTPV